MKLSNAFFVLLLFSLTIKAQSRFTIQDYNSASALKAEIIVPKISDKVYLKNSKCLLSWDAASTAAEDTLFGVIKQNSLTTGRWVKIESNAWKTYPLVSNITTSTTSRTPVSVWSFATVANRRYQIEIAGSFQTTALTTGVSIGFTTPTGMGTIAGEIAMPVAQTAVATGLVGTIFAIGTSGTLTGSFVTGTAVNPVNSPHFMKAKLIYNCTSTGRFQVNFGSEVAGSGCTLLAGSIMTVTPLN